VAREQRLQPLPGHLLGHMARDERLAPLLRRLDELGHVVEHPVAVRLAQHPQRVDAVEEGHELLPRVRHGFEAQGDVALPRDARGRGHEGEHDETQGPRRHVFQSVVRGDKRGCFEGGGRRGDGGDGFVRGRCGGFAGY